MKGRKRDGKGKEKGRKRNGAATISANREDRLQDRDCIWKTARQALKENTATTAKGSESRI